MLNCKYLLFFAAIWLTSCKPSFIAFKEETHLTKALFKNIPAIVEDSTLVIDSVQMFVAHLEELVVERDNVPEFKLVNVESKRERVDYVVEGNYHRMYLFKLFTNHDDDIIIFMGSSFNPNGLCTTLGPGYQGFIRMNTQINFFERLKVGKQNQQFELQRTKPATVKMYFYIDKSEPEADANRIKIYQVIKGDPNKIAGTKPIIFNTNKIFNDPDALVFTYQSTIQ